MVGVKMAVLLQIHGMVIISFFFLFLCAEILILDFDYIQKYIFLYTSVPKNIDKDQK